MTWRSSNKQAEYLPKWKAAHPGKVLEYSRRANKKYMGELGSPRREWYNAQERIRRQRWRDKKKAEGISSSKWPRPGDAKYETYRIRHNERRRARRAAECAQRGVVFVPRKIKPAPRSDEERRAVARAKSKEWRNKKILAELAERRRRR